MRRLLAIAPRSSAPMLCTRCRSLPADLRRLPCALPHAAGCAPPLRALACERCGAPTGAPRGSTLPDALVRLERAGLGIAGPLMRGPTGPA